MSQKDTNNDNCTIYESLLMEAQNAISSIETINEIPNSLFKDNPELRDLLTDLKYAYFEVTKIRTQIYEHLEMNRTTKTQR